MALGRKSKRDSQAHWRPDFRDVSELPDTKVIRTGFLLNFIAILLTLVLGIMYAFKEYTLQTVSSSVNVLEAQVAGSTAENNRILKANRRFEQSRRVVAEVVDFDRQVVDFPEFLRRLSTARPESIVLSRIDIGPAGGGIDGGPEATTLVELNGRLLPEPGSTASEVISRFQEAVEMLPTVGERAVRADLTRFNRNNEFGHFDFTLKVILSVENEQNP
ncbi:MAG: hypothetical protein R6V45_03010 [Oceanipulchritudo sp.]